MADREDRMGRKLGESDKMIILVNMAMMTVIVRCCRRIGTPSTSEIWSDRALERSKIRRTIVIENGLDTVALWGNVPIVITTPIEYHKEKELSFRLDSNTSTEWA